MNGFRKMQEALREHGWYVGWNLPCCQTCAWAELPYEFEDGSEIDFSKVLFNHSQDCEFELYDLIMDHFEELYEDDDEVQKALNVESEIDVDEFMDLYEDARDAVEDGNRTAVDDLFNQYGMGHLLEEMGDLDTSVSGFACYKPEDQESSLFCFDGSKKGVKNFKEIIPIIEKCGCQVFWNGDGNSRPEISWSNDE